MKSSGLSAFITLALVLSASAAPTPNHAAVEENAANAGDAYLPLPAYRPAFVRPFYRPLYRPPSTVERVANDALGVAGDVASTAGNIVGSVLHGILRRDTEDGDIVFPDLSRIEALVQAAKASLPAAIPKVTTALHNVEQTIKALTSEAANKALTKKKSGTSALPTPTASLQDEVADPTPTPDAVDLTRREVEGTLRKRPSRGPVSQSQPDAVSEEGAPPFNANELSYPRDVDVVPAFLKALQQNPAFLKALSARLAAKTAPVSPASAVADVADAVTRREVDSQDVSSKKKGKKAALPPPEDDAAATPDTDAALTEDAALTARDMEVTPAYLQSLQRNPRLAQALKQRLGQKKGSTPAQVPNPVADDGDAAADA